MLRMYGKYWWTFLIRGIMSVLFGLVALVLPGITLEIMVMLLAVFLFFDGLFSFAASLYGRRAGTQWGGLLFEGLAGIALGIFTFAWPAVTVLAIALIIGFWAMMTGVLEVIAAVKLRREIEGEWLLGLSGILSILLSGILLVNPGGGAVAITRIIGIYAILFGVSLVFLGLRLRRHKIIINL